MQLEAVAPLEGLVVEQPHVALLDVLAVVADARHLGEQREGVMLPNRVHESVARDIEMLSY